MTGWITGAFELSTPHRFCAKAPDAANVAAPKTSAAEQAPGPSPMTDSLGECDRIAMTANAPQSVNLQAFLHSGERRKASASEARDERRRDHRRRSRRSDSARRMKVAMIVAAALMPAIGLPETFDTPPARRLCPTGISIAASPAAATRISISRFQP